MVAVSHAADDSQVERLPGSELVLEVGIDVLVEVQGSGRRFKAMLVGGESERYIIIKPPASQNSATSLISGAPLTLRHLLSRGRICGFQAEVCHVITKPTRLVFVSFPAHYEILRLRKHDRVHCYQPVTFYVETHEYQGHILNVSTGGCLIVMPPLDAGDAFPDQGEALLHFRKFDSDDMGYVQGRIKSVAHGVDQAALALEFDELTDDVRASIENYVNAVYDHLAA
ncbi:MAG: PilZ domain-containing protein [Oceanidesulfovibrio sp.]